MGENLLYAGLGALAVYLYLKKDCGCHGGEVKTSGAPTGETPINTVTQGGCSPEAQAMGLAC